MISPTNLYTVRSLYGHLSRALIILTLLCFANSNYGDDAQSDHLTQKIENDYNTQFLPNTAYTNLDIRQWKIDFNFDIRFQTPHINETPYPFYIAPWEENLVLLDKHGRVYLVDTKKIESDKSNTLDLSTHIIESNLPTDINALGIFSDGSDIFVSYSKTFNECNRFIIAKASVYDLSHFEKFFSPSECSKIILGGQMTSYTFNNQEGILVTLSSEDNLAHDDRALNPASVFGKTIFIYKESQNYFIFSSGHRTSQGIITAGEIAIATEHGPQGGDEINNIRYGGNYGWPKSSYGLEYGGLSDPNYLKSHEEFGFVEPIYAFLPSIGISSITRVPDYFGGNWTGSFLIGSLNKKTLFRVLFDKTFSRVIYAEPIFLGYRIRQVISDQRRYIYISTEIPNLLFRLSVDKTNL